MISISLIKPSSYVEQCSCRECEHLPEYTQEYVFDNSSFYYIRLDTTIARIEMINHHGSAVEYYCGGCIPKLYAEIKKVLDPNLRAFQ